MKTRKSWQEKLHNGKEAKIELMPPGGRFPAGKMLIPKPLDVDSYVRKIKPGQIRTQTQMREELARKAGADYTCPLTSGIFARIVAEAAEEERAQGRSDTAPYWRLVKEDGSLNPKFPGGVDAQARNLENEGHRILRAGKTPKVDVGK